MKKVYIFYFIASLLFFTGCDITLNNKNSKTTSANSTISDHFFAENDVCVKLLNNGSLTNVHTSSPSVYISGKDVYVTFFKESKLYRFNQSNEKEFIANDTWNCFLKDNVLYCEDWGGTTASSTSLSILSEKQKIEIMNECDFTYGKSAIYVKPHGKNQLYAVKYGTNEINFVTDIPSGYYFDAEYNNYLWFYGPEGLYCSQLNGSKLKLILPDCFTVLGYRNNHIYFRKDNNLHRFSILTNEVFSFEVPLIGVRACNFTDDNCLLANEKGLFSYNSDFTDIRQISNIESIQSICVLNDTIIIGYLDESEREIFSSIDENGNILRTFQ